MKNTLLLSGFLILSTQTKAQFFLGGGVAFNSYSSGVGLFPALQPKLGVDYKEGRASIQAGFNFSPFVQKNKFNAVYVGDNAKTSILYTETLSINNAFLHITYRLGKMENTFRPKFIFGASSDMIKLKYKTAGTVPKGYTTESNVDDLSLSGPKVDIGIGADIRTTPVDDFNIEFIFGLKANQVNGMYIYNPTASHMGLTLSYSHYFGKRDYNGEW
jgi:hypothetical protein